MKETGFIKKVKLPALFFGVLVFVFTSSACNEVAEEQLLPENSGEISDGNPQGELKVEIINDVFENEEIVIAGSSGYNFIVSYSRLLNGELFDFKKTDKELPIIMEDENGNEWDVFGEAINGPDKGAKLKAVKSMMAYWFSIGTFYPGTQIYPNNDEGKFAGKSVSGTEGWTVPKNRVVSGGPGKDGIPSVDRPEFKTISGNSRKLVVGIKFGNTIKVYPHFILDWHEIVNDNIDDKYYSLVYCPLTGTATAWNRILDGEVTTFGVSGLLYNSNIIPYDRKTDSNWSQIKDEAISGIKTSSNPVHFNVIETTEASLKKMYPDSEILTTNTGFSRSYGNYPYGDYKTTNSLIFNVDFKDDRLHLKERVHAVIINGKAKVYRFESF